MSVEACGLPLVALKELEQTMVAGTTSCMSLAPGGGEYFCSENPPHVLLSLHGVGTPGSRPLDDFC